MRPEVYRAFRDALDRARDQCSKLPQGSSWDPKPSASGENFGSVSTAGAGKPEDAEALISAHMMRCYSDLEDREWHEVAEALEDQTSALERHLESVLADLARAQLLLRHAVSDLCHGSPHDACALVQLALSESQQTDPRATPPALAEADRIAEAIRPLRVKVPA